MTIPRQLGPATGGRSALPDFTRSAATVERMVRELNTIDERGPGAQSRSRRRIRTLLPRAERRDTVLRASIAAVLLGIATLGVAAGVLLASTVPADRAPGVELLLVLLAVGAASLLSAVLGLRFLLVAIGTARSRVEIRTDGVRVVGAFRSRTVAWSQIVAVESRVVHPVHWLTAALRLRDGSRVVMPALDRHIWQYSAPTGAEVRLLRTELQRRRATPPRP